MKEQEEEEEPNYGLVSLTRIPNFTQSTNLSERAWSSIMMPLTMQGLDEWKRSEAYKKSG